MVHVLLFANAGNTDLRWNDIHRWVWREQHDAQAWPTNQTYNNVQPRVLEAMCA